MSFTDVLLATAILVAAGWIFYKSFIRKKGGCAGCPECTARSCGVKNDGGKDRLIRRS
jgi:7-cyano-7-deazaguanine synthase in queuosine biosynthesis